MPQSPWTPQLDEKYYAIDMNGTVFGRVNKDTPDDAIFIKTYNFFKTREQAASVTASMQTAMWSVFQEILENCHPEHVALAREQMKAEAGVSDAEFTPKPTE